MPRFTNNVLGPFPYPAIFALMSKNLLVVIVLFSFTLQAQVAGFDKQERPQAPDYSLDQNWSALPNRIDAADVIPNSEEWIPDSLKKVDVFYVHPTVYQKGENWNADLADKKINKKVDNKPVHYQASTFNRSCRVYAPRYRQAIVEVFKKESKDGMKALDLAYGDVKKAFEYYLQHYNQGRDFIIASHSQGTCHSTRLLQEMIDTTLLRKRMIAAYVVGFTINETWYKNLRMCKNATETGCFLSWQSFKKGIEPEWKFHKNTESVNPITWTKEPATKEQSLGSVLLNISKKRLNKTSANIYNKDGEVVWVDTKVRILKRFKNMHIADYNLFWYDIRQNVQDRIDAWFSVKGPK